MPYTLENRQHRHSVSNPDSGYTDYETDAKGRRHRHALSTGCTRCDRLRRMTIHYGNWATSYAFGHAHFYKPEDIYPDAGK